MNSYWERLRTTRVTRRRALTATGSTALGSALLIACGGGSDSTIKLDDAGSSREPGTVWFGKNDWTLADESKAAVRGGIYRGVMTADQDGHYDPMTLNPGAVPFSKHVHEFLLTKNRGPGIDPTSSAAGNPRSALAESWEISTDGLTITFKMRQGVKWHPVAPVNGRVMDIDDWKTSSDRHFATGPHRATMLEVIDRAEFPDSRTMVWKMKAPYGPIFERVWSERFSHVIMPKELNANVALAEQNAIGTGSKILDKRQPAIGFEYRKNPDYWEGDPFIDRWHAPIIPEYANRYAQFISGNIMDFSPTARDILLLHKDAPETVIVAEPIPDDNASRMRFGVISPEKQIWADPRVRIAIRRSIDFKGIATFLSNRQQLEAGGIPIELRPMSHVPQHPGYALNAEDGEMGQFSANMLFDPAEARKLVAAAGHAGGVELPYFVEAVRNEVAEPDQLVMDSLAASGAFNLKIHRSQSSVEHRQYRSLLNMDGFVAQSSTSEDADYFVYRDYHSLGRVGSEGIERVPYPDPRIDRVAEAQRREIDPAKRFQHLKEFQILAAELMPALPGRHLFTTFTFRWPWLHNAHFGPGGSPPEGRPIAGSHWQWLSPDMPNRDRGAS